MPVHTVIFKVRGGDVFEVPVQGPKTYAAALRRALRFFGYARAEVIVCRGSL